MSFLAYACLIIYAGCLIFHLITVLTDQEEWKRNTKLALMPILLLFYVFAGAAKGLPVQRFHALMLVMLVFSWAGDVVLLHKNIRNLVVGAMLFFFAHLTYIALAFHRMQTLQGHGSVGDATFVLAHTSGDVKAMTFLTLSINVFLVLSVLVYFLNAAKENEAWKKLRIGAFVYFLTVLVMANMVSHVFFLRMNFTGYMGFAGAWLFLVSDLVLCHNIFVRRTVHQEVFVMAGYATAQLLLVAGL